MATVTFRKLSGLSTDATSQPAAKPRSIQYKEEVRALVKKIVHIAVRIKRSPDLYTKEVRDFVDQFKTLYEQVLLHPALNDEKFIQVMTFLARVSHFYKQDMHFLVEDLMELINHYMNTLNPNLRKKVVFSLMMLRRKGMIQAFPFISFIMKLFNCKDKELRKILFRFIIKDLKDQNAKHKNVLLNSQVQNFLLELLKKSSDNVAKRAIQLLIELYKRRIWGDAKVANIIASGCFNQNYKVRLLSCYFLISTTESQKEEVSSSEEEEGYVPPRGGGSKSVKPSKAREHRVEREKKKAIKKQKKKMNKLQSNEFFPLDLIYSPQDFVERLFNQVRKLQGDKFECKLAALAVIARMINRNKLFLIPFYAFLQKYLYPTQKDIAKILSYLAESVHENVPIEDVEAVLNHVIEQFVNDRCSEQSMTMGLRTISEMVVKNHRIITPFNINYLASYSKYKNKNVSNSAKNLINRYRELNPQMLERKYRGRQWKSLEELDGEEQVFRTDVAEGIEGADLLQEEEEQKHNKQTTVPIYYDRVLTDEDFKRIRALQRKKDQELELKALEGSEEEQIEEDDVQDDDGEISNISGESDDDDEDNAWEDDDEDDENDEEDDDDEDEEEEIPQNKLKQQNKKRRKNIADLEEEVEEDSVKDFYSSDDQEDSDDNPHGFVDPNKIARFKKTKSEQKKERREAAQNEVKEKKYTFNSKKSALASTTNKEKLKHKPLEMLRPKKNKLRNEMTNLKKKVKDLKNKLGHVRSGKEAKKLKKQKIR